MQAIIHYTKVKMTSLTFFIGKIASDNFLMCIIIYNLIVFNNHKNYTKIKKLVNISQKLI